CSNNGARITCALGTLPIRSSASVTMVVRPQATPGVTNIFSATAIETDPNTGNNSASSVTTVELAPTITTPPASLTVTQHQNAQFTVQANGTPPLFYQWFFNSAPISGSTSTVLTITNALTANEGLYRVNVTNRVGDVQSADASLTVLVPVGIAQQPQSRTNLA